MPGSVAAVALELAGPLPDPAPGQCECCGDDAAGARRCAGCAELGELVDATLAEEWP